MNVYAAINNLKERLSCRRSKQRCQKLSLYNKLADASDFVCVVFIIPSITILYVIIPYKAFGTWTNMLLFRVQSRNSLMRWLKQWIIIFYHHDVEYYQRHLVDSIWWWFGTSTNRFVFRVLSRNLLKLWLYNCNISPSRCSILSAPSSLFNMMLIRDTSKYVGFQSIISKSFKRWLLQWIVTFHHRDVEYISAI